MAAKPTVRRVTLLALGLIGGSLALALRRAGFAEELVAWGPREASLRRGLESGVIDRYSLDLDTALDGADIVVLCTPTLIAESMLPQLMKKLSADTVLTDVASVKGNLIRVLQQSGADVPPNFVPGHPIAGSERSGVGAADAELFVDHRVILTPVEQTSPAALEQVAAMWRATGAEVVQLAVDEHDRILAATSHLPHMLAYSLVDTLAQGEDGEAVMRFAAGGFRDFSRIASSDPLMWHDIVLANRDALLASIDQFSVGLARLREAIAVGDGEAVRECFERAKGARDRFVAHSAASSASASHAPTEQD